jgi:hypothetical protein
MNATDPSPLSTFKGNYLIREEEPAVRRVW